MLNLQAMMQQLAATIEAMYFIGWIHWHSIEGTSELNSVVSTGANHIPVSLAAS